MAPNHLKEDDKNKLFIKTCRMCCACVELYFVFFSSSLLLSSASVVLLFIACSVLFAWANSIPRTKFDLSYEREKNAKR